MFMVTASCKPRLMPSEHGCLWRCRSSGQNIYAEKMVE
ncbi:hypothetical protein NMH_1972 [Neisseria meningitidis H44/76]|uniref:Uncharacterized protein n=1 Tax=Neisseria meningitidis serogroup B / serotype 15 (strain H44/76) TaxID=909420 RepID=E6MYX3_NEIMH|nr:hypothetical protein NMH_1972 [Neisseria meningitidis H44/76]